MQGDGILILSGLAMGRQNPPFTQSSLEKPNHDAMGDIRLFDAGLAGRQRASSIFAGRMHLQPRVGDRVVL
jgi:hypothetical protein